MKSILHNIVLFLGGVLGRDRTDTASSASCAGRAAAHFLTRRRETSRKVVLAALLFVVMPLRGLQAQWSTPVNVTRVASGFAWRPSVVEDSTGSLHATWTNELPNSAVWIGYSCKPADADTWAIPIHLNRDSLLYRIATIAIGPGHVPYVVWTSEDEYGHLYYTHRSGDTWITPAHVPDWTQFGTAPRAAGDDEGRLHVVWSDHRTIWYARFDGTTWTRPETAATSDSRSLNDPDIAINREGLAHVVYHYSRDTAGYIEQTAGGWSLPQHLSNGALSGGSDPRIGLDTSGLPQVVWWDRLHAVFCGSVGDSWLAPERLDAVWGGVLPNLCVDPWNRVHAFYFDNGRTLEKTRHHGRWSEPQLVVDTLHHYVEAVADDEKLHVLIEVDRSPDWYYSFRRLGAPGIAIPTQRPVLQFVGIPSDPVTPNTRIAFALNSPARTLVEIFDTSGRSVFRISLGVLAAGRHEFRPFDGLPAAGIYTCRIIAGEMSRTVKLVRIN